MAGRNAAGRALTTTQKRPDISMELLTDRRMRVYSRRGRPGDGLQQDDADCETSPEAYPNI